MRNLLKDYAIHYRGNVNKMMSALHRKYEVPSYSYKFPYLTCLDADYPKSFLSLQQPPIVLFYKGNLELLKARAVSVIGSREPSAYGQKWTKHTVSRLAEHFVVVSGFARGIDTIAHQTAVIGGSTIAVMGCGLDKIYPPENRHLFEILSNHHLILSEYPQGVAPQASHFPVRNRLIAALGERCYVMAAKLRSGTMITVNNALELNKTIYCLPYPLDDKTGQGCNQCILEGAMILTNEHDLSMI